MRHPEEEYRTAYWNCNHGGGGGVPSWKVGGWDPGGGGGMEERVTLAAWAAYLLFNMRALYKYGGAAVRGIHKTGPLRGIASFAASRLPALAAIPALH